MRANRGRKFKAPRLLKEKETARQSESDEDDIPFSELKEQVRAERQSSDSEEDNIPFSQIQTKTTIRADNTRKDRPLQEKVKMIKLMSEREADECAKDGEVQTWSDDVKQEEVPMSYLGESLKNTPRTSLEDTGPEEDVNVGTDLEETESPEKMVGSKIAREWHLSGEGASHRIRFGGRGQGSTQI
jgi:hypothetical protein